MNFLFKSTVLIGIFTLGCGRVTENRSGLSSEPLKKEKHISYFTGVEIDLAPLKELYRLTPQELIFKIEKDYDIVFFISDKFKLVSSKRGIEGYDEDYKYYQKFMGLPKYDNIGARYFPPFDQPETKLAGKSIIYLKKAGDFDDRHVIFHEFIHSYIERARTVPNYILNGASVSGQTFLKKRFEKSALAYLGIIGRYQKTDKDNIKALLDVWQDMLRGRAKMNLAEYDLIKNITGEEIDNCIIHLKILYELKILTDGAHSKEFGGVLTYLVSSLDSTTAEAQESHQKLLKDIEVFTKVLLINKETQDLLNSETEMYLIFEQSHKKIFEQLRKLGLKISDDFKMPK